MSACRVCRNSRNNQRHIFQEQHLGLRDEFEYVECAACDSLSIVEIPSNMERYYPPTYYSYGGRPYHRLAGHLRGERDRYYLTGTGIVGRLVSFGSAAPTYIAWLTNLSLPFGSRILDVGSGGGTLVVNLQDAGFRATGIDPYIGSPITFPNGAVVLRQSLEQTSGSYDCIMLHHCLEHMAAPLDAFQHVSRLLKPGGKVLIRMPVAGSHAWRTYKGNWFQLDAPRHFAIFSEQGLRRLAGDAGFSVERIVYDSTAFQFWASEQCVKGIAMVSQQSYAVNPDKSLLSAHQMAEYARQAALLNARNDGDQAAYYLRKVST